jgi:drug/metabolite transporter superfamily protein YnfA
VSVLVGIMRTMLRDLAIRYAGYLLAIALMLAGCLLMIADASFAGGAWTAFAGVVVLIAVRVLGPFVPGLGQNGDGDFDVD